MLVVTRRSGETIYIDGNKIKVKVLDTRGKQIKLGIEAPKKVSVHREEVYEHISAQKAANEKKKKDT